MLAAERAAALTRSPSINASNLEFLRQADGANAADAAARTDPTRPEAIAELERTMIRRALAEAHGSRAEAARRLSINRQLLYDEMQRHGLDAPGQVLPPSELGHWKLFIKEQ